jgi:uncharacterized membrane protein
MDDSDRAGFFMFFLAIGFVLILIVINWLSTPTEGQIAGQTIRMPMVGWVGFAAFAVLAIFLYFRYRA